MARMLPLSDAHTLGSIVRAAWDHQLVAWTDPDARDGFHWGVARWIGDLVGNPIGDLVDVRDAYLRVTLSTGVDAYQLMSDAMRMVQCGYLVLHYNQHPDAHGPGVWCPGCPPLPPGLPVTVADLVRAVRVSE